MNVQQWNRDRANAGHPHVALFREDLSGLDLSGIKFINVSLVGADLRDTIINNSTWKHVAATDANMDGCQAWRASFSHVNFSNVSWRETVKSDTWWWAKFRYCHFIGADVRERYLTRVVLEHVDFTDANIRHCDFSNLEAIDEVTLPETDQFRYIGEFMVHAEHDWVRVGCSGKTLEEWEACLDNEVRFRMTVSELKDHYQYALTYRDEIMRVCKECEPYDHS